MATWLVFGLLLGSGPVVVANGLTGMEVMFLVWLEVRHAQGKGSGRRTAAAD